MTEPTMNQYAPPRAHVEDAPSTTGVRELKLFSAKGRIGRLRYLAYSFTASTVYSIAITAMTPAFGASGLMAGITILSFVALLWFSIVTGIKRCHDINISGWWSATTIVPIIAVVWMVVPGSKGGNRFGSPPPPNTWGVRVLGVLTPLFFLVGIIAAVSIPAYKDYTERARAARAAGPQ